MILSKLPAKHSTQSSLDLTFEKFLSRDKLEEDLFAKAIIELKPKGLTTLEEVMQCLRDSISLSIIAKGVETLNPFENEIKNVYKTLQRYYEGPDIPLIQASTVLLNYYLSVADTLSSPPSAAMPLDPSSLWSWGRSPHLLYHAELAILTLQLAKIYSDPDWLKAGFEMANWHLELLDVNFEPFVGLYCMEEDYNKEALYYLYACLFNKAALLGGGAFLKAAAIKFKEKIRPLTPTLNNRGYYTLILDSLIQEDACSVNQEEGIALKSLQLKEVFQGSFAAYRHPGQSVQFGLQGASSGMGAFHSDGVQIRTFGFQQSPLGELYGFGLDPVASTIAENTTLSFPPLKVSGKCRLAPQSRDNTHMRTYRSSLPSTLWADCQMSFEENGGLICTGKLFPLLQLPKTLYFSFYIHAEELKAGDSFIAHGELQKHVLDATTQFSMSSHGKSINLSLLYGFSEVEIIPLGGEDHFWGAKFLIACRFNGQSTEFKWILS